jgi:hypothetical protein
MMTPLRPNQYFDALVDEQRRWLSEFDPRYLANWEKNLSAAEESALAEAGVRRLLEGYGVRVEPNEDLTGAGQRPDFRCEVNGNGFEVEVTHISIEKATRVTGLVEGRTGACNYSSLNDAIFVACKGKAEQCAHALHPTLLAVATFHSQASMICLDKPHVETLLTGETKITWGMDMRTCQKVGDVYQSTELRSAAFLRPDGSQEVGFARSSISALVLCGLGALSRDSHGVWRPKVIGVLHPNAARPFNPAILPPVEFGQVALDRPFRQLHVTWPQGDVQ